MKRLTYIIVFVGFLVLAGYLFVRFSLQSKNVRPAEAASPSSPVQTLNLQPLFIAKIKQLVKDGSHGLYNLAVDSMQVDVFHSKVTLFNVALAPDSVVLARLKAVYKIPADVFKVKFRSLHIDGIGINDVLSHKVIDLDTLIIQHPVIEVYHQALPKKQAAEDSVTLYRRLMGQMKSISVKNIFVHHGTLINHNQAKQKTTRFNEVFLQVKNLLIDSTTQYDSSRFFFAKGATLSFKDYMMRTADGLYNFKLGAVVIDALQRHMTVNGAMLQPLYTKQAFQKKITYCKERYDLLLPKLVFENINWWGLANEEGFIARTATISNARLDVYLNRSQPASPPRIGNYPQQVLMKLPLPVSIAKINVRNFQVQYEEFNPVSGRSGKVYLDRINGQISNLTNRPEDIRRKKMTTIAATTQLMHQIPLATHIRFDLSKYKEGSFWADVRLAPFDAVMMNEVSEPLGMVTIKSCQVNEAKGSMYGNNKKGVGKVLLLYDNLHIAALKKTADDELKRKKLFSLLANVVVIKNANPSGKDEPRTPDCVFPRDPSGNFFNLIWKTMLTGILKTVGANPKLAESKSN